MLTDDVSLQVTGGFRCGHVTLLVSSCYTLGVVMLHSWCGHDTLLVWSCYTPGVAMLHSWCRHVTLLVYSWLTRVYTLSSQVFMEHLKKLSVSSQA